MSDESKQPSTFTSAERIRQLNEIDQDVTNLLNSAGLAIQALTNSQPQSTDGSVESHKTQFKEATRKYFALLSSIDVQLRRQVYALEEASVLAPESTSRAGDSTSTGAGGAGAGATAGAATPLDVSWLNSRKDTVGKDKEAELWASARGFVERLGQSDSEHHSDKQHDEPEKMQMD